MNFISQYPCLTILFTALTVNIPLGYGRSRSQKFSLKWIFWIHASIPLIVWLRLNFHISSSLIPVFILFAIIGQMIGGRIRLQRTTRLDKEKLCQIPNLHLRPTDSQTIADSDVMVVLLNMGGPKNLAGVRDFLKRLFRDPLLMRIPLSKILQPFFAWLIVSLRTKAVEQRYQSIGGGSPVFESTTAQMDGLKAELLKRGRSMDVTFCFNYSDPLPADVITNMRTKNKKYILPISLYPQYSNATTGSSLSVLKKAAGGHPQELKFLETPSYYMHDGYIQSLTDRILEQLQPGESLDDYYLIFSAHGLPLYFVQEGDPYPSQINQTVACILKNLNRHHAWVISYQSAVGPLQWLKPSTQDIIEALAQRHVKKILVIPVSFVTDHIETLYEINIKYRQLALKWGVEDFRMSKAIECHPAFIQALADQIECVLPKPFP